MCLCSHRRPTRPWHRQDRQPKDLDPEVRTRNQRQEEDVRRVSFCGFTASGAGLSMPDGPAPGSANGKAAQGVLAHVALGPGAACGASRLSAAGMLFRSRRRCEDLDFPARVLVGIIDSRHDRRGSGHDIGLKPTLNLVNRRSWTRRLASPIHI